MTDSKLLLNPIELREKWRKLPDYGCFWSSPDNSRGFRLTPTLEPGRLSVEMEIEREHSGFPGIAHGGIAYTIIDGLMGWYIMSHYGRAGFTIGSQVKYFAPLHVGKRYLFEVKGSGSQLPPGQVALTGTALGIENGSKPLVKIDAQFILPNRETAKKVLGVELGEAGEELFPDV